MKLGVLTFHYGSNYGGVLQCYALQQVLKGMGHDVYVINYVPHDGLKKFLFVLLYFIRRRNVESLKALWHYVFYHKKSRAVFRDFRTHYLSMTKEEKDIEKFSDIELDAIFVGSDQVWNYSQQKRKAYFLGWVNNKNIKKNSYAACCGLNSIDERYRNEVINQLSLFTAISVRSEETQLFIKELLNKTVQVVADPTILYDFNEFLAPSNQHYILTYILTEDIKGGNEKAIEIIRKNYPGLPVYSIIISDRQPRLCKWADKKLYDVRPDEWVNLIYNCSFLYTDSFHGSVFAMKFGKPFVAYYGSEVAGRRFMDLKKMYHLQNVITEAIEVADVFRRNVCTSDTFRSISHENIKESLSFIEASLCK